MTTALIRTLPLAVFLLAATSGCEFIDFERPIDPLGPPSGIDPGDGGFGGPAPLYPFRPGSTWQYTVTALDGSQTRKFVSIDKAPVMVGGIGAHQLEMAYPVRTSGTPGGQAYFLRWQQAVGDQIVNYREATLNQWDQMVVDINWDPQQLEIDQSSERTRVGASWAEIYKGDVRHLGGMVSQLKRNETWKVVGQEVLPLPGIPTPFQTIVFQKSDTQTPSDAGAPSDAGRADTGSPPVGDGGTRPPPVLTSPWSEAVDGGAMMPKTLWYARGYGKVKEAGGGEPTEELSGLELK
jgi:hypothetical protein